MPDREASSDKTGSIVREAATAEAFGPAAPRLAESLPRALRPQAKLFAHGARSLSGAELLGLLLGGARRREPVELTAERLLRCHGLRGLARLEPRAWLDAAGLTELPAARLSAAFEGRTLLERHRMVNDALRGLFGEQIHALALKTVAPSEM